MSNFSTKTNAFQVSDGEQRTLLRHFSSSNHVMGKTKSALKAAESAEKVRHGTPPAM